jgi:hypothetical protein
MAHDLTEQTPGSTRQSTRRPDPVTVTAHHLRPDRPAAATVNTEVVKQSRRFTTATGALASDGAVAGKS